jgi:uncharacterized RDD family membrane protein YckC
MPEHEPAVLRDGPAASEAGDAGPPAAADRDPAPAPAPAPAPPSTDAAAPAAAAVARGAAVHVVGFWRRLLAALIDLAIILPVALVLTLIAGKLTGVRPPAGLDIWLLLLDNEPALAMGFGLVLGVAAVYVLVFQITRSRTIGMRVLHQRIIDVYGDPPSPGRCVVRTLGYLLGVVTLFLGFIWIGFDSEKRGLHDWIAGTYVIQE